MATNGIDELANFIHDNYTENDINSFIEFSQELLNSSLNDDNHSSSVAQRYELAKSVWNTFKSRPSLQNTVEFSADKIEAANNVTSVLHIISDDKPFIIDSLTHLLRSEGYKITECLHPVIDTETINLNAPSNDPDNRAHISVIYMELAGQINSDEKSALRQKVLHLLSEIDAVTSDWSTMRSMAETASLAQSEQANLDQVNSFLQWLNQDNFTFLGYYLFGIDGNEIEPTTVQSLGIFRSIDDPLSLSKAELNAMTGELEAFINSDSTLLVSKSDIKSRVHRNDYYDQISVKQYAPNGNIVAIHRFTGLFTQSSNKLNPVNIPYLKHKLAMVLEQIKFKPHSHSFKKFKYILESLPKRELFESTVDELFLLAKGIFKLNEKGDCGTFVRENCFNQQVSVLVFVAKDVFCTDLRNEIETELCNAYNGKILTRHSMLNDNPLAQWHFNLVKGKPSETTMSVDELVARIEAKAKSWVETLSSLIYEKWGDSLGNQLVARYSNSFSKSYREQFSVADALSDIEQFEKIKQDNTFQFRVYRSPADPDNIIRLNIYTHNQGVALSDSFPILENFGFRPLGEFSFKVLSQDSTSDLYTYTLECSANITLELDKIKNNLEQGLASIWQKDIENDGYNKLLVCANIDVRQIVIIRAYGKYLRQLNLGYSEEYFQQALLSYPQIVNQLLALFNCRFSLNGDTQAARLATANDITQSLFEALNDVVKIDHDRILRNYIAAISATVRTNFYQNDKFGQPKNYCSFKILTSEINEAPLPKPHVETFVYSPRVEGVHLRFGSVSRGGLRWSDRQEDFRTEVLGLVKAQQVKNAVIVPAGAKGGFVPKQLPTNASRELVNKEAIACYKIFISGLLDLTDNNTAQGIIKPPETVCFDDDDSYLVVAADKGTATFSDIANELAHEYGFWLGDAFASGGSIGYDHKKMGITAKGAWVSVQRHFREMSIDIQTQEFTVVGIGDMSGDVFGNGMLCSNTIKLVAAFDHRDIFLDPSPDPAKSFLERQRLFQLPRSSWNDYDSALISTGSGVYSRSLKRVPLQPQIKELLNIDSDIDSLSPDELIRCILKSKADLLWFGGIGTYVKSTQEINTEVGDKNNDSLRINGSELQCKVIGEGGNLGCTQLARVEYAKAGGRINTDAVDNSAGVNCSDNEVNIKILLNGLVTGGQLSKAGRDTLLEEMTEEVGKMVLQNNYYQAQALSLDETNSHTRFDSFTRLTHYLVNSVELNRELEYLPDDEELQVRNASNNGLTRPELAVLLAYSKMDVHNALLQQHDLLEDPYFNKYLLAAFPPTLVEQYGKFIIEHPLAKQIIATSVANEIFNRGGIHAVREQTGASISDIVKAFVVTKEIFKLDAIWNDIESLEGAVSAQIQIKMMIEVQRFYRLMAIWFIKNVNATDSIREIIDRYSPGLSTLHQLNSEEISLPFSPIDQSLYQLTQGTRGLDMVTKIHQLKVTSVVFCDIVKTSIELGFGVEDILPCYSQVSNLIGLPWLIAQTEKVGASGHWSRLARFALLLDLLELREKLVVDIANAYPEVEPSAAIKAWASSSGSELKRIESVIDDLKISGAIDIDKLCFINRQIRTLLR